MAEAKGGYCFYWERLRLREATAFIKAAAEHLLEVAVLPASRPASSNLYTVNCDCDCSFG